MEERYSSSVDSKPPSAASHEPSQVTRPPRDHNSHMDSDDSNASVLLGLHTGNSLDTSLHVSNASRGSAFGCRTRLPHLRAYLVFKLQSKSSKSCSCSDVRSAPVYPRQLPHCPNHNRDVSRINRIPSAPQPRPLSPKWLCFCAYRGI